jgi:hypothetical protein
VAKVSENLTEIPTEAATRTGREAGREEAQSESERARSRKEFQSRVNEISQSFESTQVLHQNR